MLSCSRDAVIERLVRQQRMTFTDREGRAVCCLLIGQLCVVALFESGCCASIHTPSPTIEAISRVLASAAELTPFTAAELASLFGADEPGSLR